MSERDPMIGVAIGRYIIRSKLAEGGMGAVYVASHERLSNVKKVVKVLLPEYSRNAIIRQRFEREATAAARLKHRNIIAIDDFGALPDGQLFLMMPFLDGKSLETHIRQNVTLTHHHTLHVIVQVCRALQHLHESGIVHRDLKPGNIFLTETDDNPYEVTLIDLGIARDIAEEDPSVKTLTGMAMGTPGYMAVEQYGNAGAASPAADLYAAAIITWEMLTGHTPWGLHDPRVMYHLQMTERPTPPDGLPIEPALLELLRQALSVQPKDRPASARAFAVAFASMTPAIPPHVPSGAEILGRFAKEFVQNASPNIETVRNASGSDHVAPVLWPYRSTQVPHLPNEVPVIGLPPAMPISAATVNERAAVAPVGTPRPTTLSASSGVTQPPAHPSAKRYSFVLSAVGACVIVAAAATFGLLRSRDGAHPVEPSTSVRIDAAVREVITPMIDATPRPADAPFSDASIDAPSPAVVPVDASAATPKPNGLGLKRVQPSSTKTTSSTAQPDAGVATPRGSAAKFDPDAVEE